MDSIILRTDSYKITHWKQYPKNTTHVYSYFESRGGDYTHTLFFGLQYYLKKYLVGPRVTHAAIEEAEKFTLDHFGVPGLFNKDGWLHVINDHNGTIPVVIKAAREGSIIPVKNVLFTVENTCPKCFWVTSYLETLLEKVWYPTTIATKSYFQKQVIKKYLSLTGDDIPDFKLHDFGYRGSSSEESAGIGGMAHLINFKGTDTLAGIRYAQGWYGMKDMPAFSVPAAEHSTITAWGRNNEAEAYENMLDQFPTGLVAVVSDSYDVYNAVLKIWGDKLKDKVENRKGTLIIRPDSGQPIVVLLNVLNTLGAIFGVRVNKKGYKVLPPYVRLIQGDGIDEQTLPAILEGLADHKWSADNLAFGSGGGLLQNVNRDTLRFAYKCSNVTIDGEDRAVYKDPVTDPGKKSKKGRLGLAMDANGKYETVEITKESETGRLETVFEDGELLIDQKFDDIRKLADINYAL